MFKYYILYLTNINILLLSYFDVCLYMFAAYKLHTYVLGNVNKENAGKKIITLIMNYIK